MKPETALVRALAILGPRASAADVGPFRVSGVEIRVARTISAGDELDAVLVFGGDGTMHHQLASAIAAQIPLLPVPLGSGNDFAHALGICNRAAALAAWRKFCGDGGNIRAIDVGVITGTDTTRNEKLERRDFFCCVAGAGLDSEANRRANAMPRWLRARGGYALGVVGALARYRPQTVRLTAEAGGVTCLIERPATMVAIGNAPSYGSGMRIAPRAQLDDGLLDVCFVRRVTRLRLLRFFPRVYSGKHLGMAEVEYVQTSRLRIETDPPLPVYADGEFIRTTPVEISVAPKALTTIIP